VSSRQRWLASAAIVLVAAAAPLRGLIAFASGRACAPASCCMAKGQACPMHHAGGEAGGCRLRSCGGGDAAISISQAPLAIASPAVAQPTPTAPATAARVTDDAVVAIAAAPPDPPPPRRAA
jgi:hypothetical protein